MISLSTVLPGALNDLNMRGNSWLLDSRGFTFSSRWDFDHISRLMWEALGSFQGSFDFATHQFLTDFRELLFKKNKREENLENI